MEFSGERDGSSVRVVVRPSGTEPKLKCYLEVVRPPSDELGDNRTEATRICAMLSDEVRAW
nr:phosphomannomutase PmmB [Mycolicibacter nonchromogenicus]